MEFVAFSTATEQLAAQASYISYGPARKSSASPATGFAKVHAKEQETIVNKAFAK